MNKNCTERLLHLYVVLSLLALKHRLDRTEAQQTAHSRGDQGHDVGLQSIFAGPCLQSIFTSFNNARSHSTQQSAFERPPPIPTAALPRCRPRCRPSLQPRGRGGVVELPRPPRTSASPLVVLRLALSALSFRFYGRACGKPLGVRTWLEWTGCGFEQGNCCVVHVHDPIPAHTRTRATGRWENGNGGGCRPNKRRPFPPPKAPGCDAPPG